MNAEEAAVDIAIHARGNPHIGDGTPVVVEARDLGLADAASAVASQAKTVVHNEGDDIVARVRLPLRAVTQGLTVFAHVRASGSSSISKGDFITKQAYPVPGVGMRLDIDVEEV